MKLAFMYAGQGSQKPGMGLDLYEKYPVFSKTIDDLSAVTSFDLKQVMFSREDALLNRTEITQPVLSAYAAGVTAVLRANNIQPDVVLGLSLGEYSALHAAGVFDETQLVSLTEFRGQAMASAGEGVETLMCAVLGLTPEKTEEACKKASEDSDPEEWVQVVNYNTVGQEVISGTKNAVKLAEVYAKELGAKRCMELKVSSAFHTFLMEDASKALEKKFKTMKFHKMETPVVFNTTGSFLQDEESIPELLVKQVKSPVKMRQSIEYLKEMGVTHVIEIGPGRALSGFVKRGVSGIETVSIEDANSMKAVLDQFGEE